MKLRNWREMIVRAVGADGERLADLALYMRDCERAKECFLQRATANQA